MDRAGRWFGLFVRHVLSTRASESLAYNKVIIIIIIIIINN